MLCYVVVGLSFIMYFIGFCIILHPDVGRLLNFLLRNVTVAAMPVRPAKNLVIMLFIHKVKAFSVKYSIRQFTIVV